MHRPLIVSVALFAACQDDGETTDSATHTHEHAAEAFALRFAATVDGAEVGCGDAITGVGPAGAHTIGMSDLRFYVSDVVFRDADGNAVEATFDEDEFQYTGANGWVGLVDLTGNADGSCASSSISFSEGTARTHEAITGETHLDEVASVSFSVGVPQALMGEVIAENTPEGAPSPLGEMYWSWATGYRHFVFNLTVSDGVTDGEGYLHVGSTACAGDGENALESKDACDFVNTPSVELASFDLATDTVAVDLGALLAGMDFLSPVYDPETFEIIGETVGVECHSSPLQPDCPFLFDNLGLDIGTGAADASGNAVFGTL